MTSLRILIALIGIFSASYLFSQKTKQEFYSLTIYQVQGSSKEKAIDAYLQNTYLPSIHKLGKNKIGVFKPIVDDTVSFGKFIYVLVPYTSLDEFNRISLAQENDSKFKTDGGE